MENEQSELSLKQKIDDYACRTQLPDETKSTGRTYVTPEGNKYPSVTTILGATSDKTFLVEWRKRIGAEKADEITKQASGRGTSMHKLLEDNFNGLPVDPSVPGYIYFKQLKIYWQKITPLGLEIPLYSDRLKTAGRTDCIGMYDKQLSIIDYKTARKTKKAEWIEDYFLQSAIYAMMTFERMELMPKQIVILIATEEGMPQEFKRRTGDFIRPAYNRVMEYWRKHEEAQ